MTFYPVGFLLRRNDKSATVTRRHEPMSCTKIRLTVTSCGT
ncbi:MAG: hypothetical protein JWQ40_4288 [Segetibacter sp.]|nr:hypothetical protein [Segetibacter sp.]